MDVRSLKTPGALTAWAVARLSKLMGVGAGGGRRGSTIQNRIDGSEGSVRLFCARARSRACVQLPVGR